MIREYEDRDFEQVVRLLKDNDVDPPADKSELKGPCIVADDGEICGVIFALAGESSKAYVDYLAIRKDLQGTRLYYRLLTAMDNKLKSMGIKKYVFHVEKWNTKTFNQLFKYREKYRITMLNDLHYFMRTL
jgi:N-acetylglutamate synthase-like GNAT family acetyltransferase